MEFQEFHKVFTDLDSNKRYDIYMTAYSSGALSGIIQGNEFDAFAEGFAYRSVAGAYNYLDVEVLQYCGLPSVKHRQYITLKKPCLHIFTKINITASESWAQGGIT